MLDNIAFFSIKKENITWVSTLTVGGGENLLCVPTLLSGIEGPCFVLSPIFMVRNLRFGLLVIFLRPQPCRAWTQTTWSLEPLVWLSLPVADPDLELRGGGGPVLIYLPCRPFSLQSFLLFLPKIRGGPRPPPPAPPLDPPLITPACLHVALSNAQKFVPSQSVLSQQRVKVSI